jgi:hypothetical protein
MATSTIISSANTRSISCTTFADSSQKAIGEKEVVVKTSVTEMNLRRKSDKQTGTESK